MYFGGTEMVLMVLTGVAGMPDRRLYEFGPFRLDATGHLLFRDARSISASPCLNTRPWMAIATSTAHALWRCGSPEPALSEGRITGVRVRFTALSSTGRRVRTPPPVFDSG